MTGMFFESARAFSTTKLFFANAEKVSKANARKRKFSLFALRPFPSLFFMEKEFQKRQKQKNGVSVFLLKEKCRGADAQKAGAAFLLPFSHKMVSRRVSYKSRGR